MTERKRRLPEFITDVFDDKPAFRVLIAAAATMFAIGLDPLVLDPGQPTIQSAIRGSPELQSLALFMAVARVAALLIGGVVGDTLRSRRLATYAVLGLAVASFVAMLLPFGPALLATRIVASLLTGLALPFAIGSVAVAYSGRTRATALGITYAAFGAATAISPALVRMSGAGGPLWPAFLLCGVAAVMAWFVVRRDLPDLPGALPEHRPYVAATALWAFGVTAIVASLIDLRIDPIGVALIIGGTACIGIAYWLIRRAAGDGEPVRVEMRPVAVVLAVGIIVGFAQAVPLSTLPQFFLLIQGIPSLLATAALAPFVLALIAAGPIAGWLLGRVGPRTLIAGGMVAIGLADLSVALVLGLDAGLVLFIVPYALLGAGFVIATTVRTAVIFASVPKRLPASAAALNEASIGLGTRMGVVVSTVIVTQVALATYSDGLVGLPADEIERQLEPLRGLLLAMGLPTFPDLLALTEQSARAGYAEAVIAGMRVGHVLAGAVAVIGGAIAFVALGQRDPVREVWEHRDERDLPES